MRPPATRSKPGVEEPKGGHRHLKACGAGSVSAALRPQRARGAGWRAVGGEGLCRGGRGGGGGSNLLVGDAGSRSACRRRQPSKRRCRRRPASGNRTPTPTGSCASRRAQPAGRNGRRMPEDDLLGARTIESTMGTHSSATCRSWCGEPGCRVDLPAADEQELKELRLSRRNSSACWTWTEAPPPAQKSPANLGGGL